MVVLPLESETFFFCLVLYLPLSLRAAALAQEEGSWHLSLCRVTLHRGKLWAQGFRKCAVPCGAPAWGGCWPEKWLRGGEGRAELCSVTLAEF